MSYCICVSPGVNSDVNCSCQQLSSEQNLFLRTRFSQFWLGFQGRCSVIVYCDVVVKWSTPYCPARFLFPILFDSAFVGCVIVYRDSHSSQLSASKTSRSIPVILSEFKRQTMKLANRDIIELTTAINSSTAITRSIGWRFANCCHKINFAVQLHTVTW